MRKNKILILALLVCLSIPVRAQNTDNNIIGIVVDKSGNPVYGASVNVELAFEGLRLFDLYRWKELDKAVKCHFHPMAIITIDRRISHRNTFQRIY